MLMGSTIETKLLDVKVKCEEWMFHHAFPFWAEHGVDKNGGFFESVSIDGIGKPAQLSRVRVQARQTFCFALAAQLGWRVDTAKELALFGCDVLYQQCRRSDGLYGKTMIPGRGLVDDQAELYDCAFALLAYATTYRVTRDEKVLEQGSHLRHSIEKILGPADAQIDFLERLPAPKIREQNPLMHLCEASAAWFEATGDDDAIEWADQLIELTLLRFFNASKGVLMEFDRSCAMNHCEVGHMYEWVWLIDRVDRLRNRSLRLIAFNLYHGAQSLRNDLPYIPLKQTLDGGVLDATQRTWVRTEALKAHMAMYRLSGSDVIAGRVCDEVYALFDLHLHAGTPLGTWMDDVDADGQGVSSQITAATGYHLYLALSELLPRKL